MTWLLIVLCIKFQLLSALGNAVQAAQENVEDVKQTQNAIYRMAQQDAKAAVQAAKKNAAADVAAAPKNKKSAVRVEAADHVKNVKQWEASVLEMAKSESQETIQAAKHRVTAAVATVSNPSQPVGVAPAAQEHVRMMDVEPAQKEALERAVQAANRATVKQQAAEQVAAAQRSQAQLSQKQAAVQVAAASTAKQAAEKATAAADARLKVETAAQENAKLDEQKAVQAAQARAAEGVVAANRAKQSAEDEAKRDRQKLMASAAKEAAAANTAKQAAGQATLEAQERVTKAKHAENENLLKAKAEEQKASLEQERAAAEMTRADREMKAASTAMRAVKQREKELADHQEDASPGQSHLQLIMGLGISIFVAVFGLSLAAFMYSRSSSFSRVCRDLDERSNKVSLLEEEKTILRQQLDELREDFTGMQNMVGMQQDMLDRQQDLTKELVHSNGGLSRQVSASDVKPTRCRGNSSASTMFPTDSSNSLGLNVDVAPDALAFATECARVRAQWLGLADSPPDSDSGAGDSDTDGSQSRSDSDLTPRPLSLPTGSQECAPSMISAAVTSVKSLSHIIPTLKFPVPSVPGFSNNLNYLEQGLLGDSSFKKIGDEAWRDAELALERDGALLQVDGSDKENGNASPLLTSRSVESHKSNSTSASGKWWGGRMFLLSSNASASQDRLAETPRVFQREGRLSTKKAGKHLSGGPESYNIGTSRGPQNYNIGTARGSENKNISSARLLPCEPDKSWRVNQPA